MWICLIKTYGGGEPRLLEQEKWEDLSDFLERIGEYCFKNLGTEYEIKLTKVQNV